MCPMSTRERILDAAMEVFARFGFRRASMDQVAQEAGLTRQAVYHHFKSKEALFRAAVEALHEGAFAAEVEAGRASEAAGDSLADILAAQIDARFRYIVCCLTETSEADELLSERQLQTRDLTQASSKAISVCMPRPSTASARRRASTARGMTALELARCLQIAIRSFSDLRFDAGALDDLGQMVRLIARGAVDPRAAPPSAVRAGRNLGKSRKSRARGANLRPRRSRAAAEGGRR